MADMYDMDDGMPARSDFGGHDGPGNGPGSPGSAGGPGGPGGPGGYEGNMTTRGGQQSSIVDPDGNYIHLMNDEGEQEVVIPIAAVCLPYSVDGAERNRRLENALHSREDQRGIGGNNPYIGDFFIPDSFKKWLMNEGRVEFIPHGGKRFVRAVPLAEDILRFQREQRGRGYSDGEITRKAQGYTLLEVLEWLAKQGEFTYLHKWCMWVQSVREENMRRIADRRTIGSGDFPPPSDFPSPHMFAGDMSPRSPHGYGRRRRPPPPHPHGMPMDPEMLMHLRMGGEMPPPPPPEFYGYARERRGPRRPGPRDPRFRDFYGGGYYY